LKLANSERFSAGVVAELRRIRLSKGISQKTLAEAAGVSRAAVTHIEAGIRNPTLIVCHALAAALGIRFSSLSRRVENQRDS
jgi:transcriptional regulator with XRE-family HTH domain